MTKRPPGTENSRHFADVRDWIGKVVRGDATGDDVERRVRERQAFRLGNLERDIRHTLAEWMNALGGREHLRRKVAGNDVSNVWASASAV